MASNKQVDVKKYSFLNMGTLNLVRGLAITPKEVTESGELGVDNCFYVINDSALIPQLPDASSNAGVVIILGNASSSPVGVVGISNQIVAAGQAKIFVSTGSSWLTIG
jgi:hypothetical protein